MHVNPIRRVWAVDESETECSDDSLPQQYLVEFVIILRQLGNLLRVVVFLSLKGEGSTSVIFTSKSLTLLFGLF